MQNFLRNAAGVIKAAQEVHRTVQRQRSRSQSGERGADVQLYNLAGLSLTKHDQEQCFSLMADAKQNFYVVFVPSNLGFYKTTDRNLAARERDRLNLMRTVALAANQNGKLKDFAAKTQRSPEWMGIHLASYLGCDDIVNDMCSRNPGVEVNRATSGECYLPLHIAVMGNHAKTAALLMAYGGNIRKPDNKSNNALHLAVRQNTEICQVLHNLRTDEFVAALRDRNDSGYTPFHLSLRTQNADLIKFLAKNGAETNLSGIDTAEYPITPTALKALLSVNPNALIGTSGHKCKTIFHHSFDRNLLKVAYAIVPAIVDHGDENGRTPLHEAVRRADLNSAICLISYGSKLESVGKLGNSPLHLAIKLDRLTLTKLLIASGASLDIKNSEGLTPLDIPCTNQIKALFKEIQSSHRSAKVFPQYPNKIVEIAQTAAIKKAKSLKGPTHRLLSLDGGGIRGISTIMVLQAIEKHLDGNLIDYFDWIAGTSTGAIIALTLADGHSLEECLKLYLQMKDDVFCGNRPYNPAPLDNLLHSYFGDRRMADLDGKRKVVVTATRMDFHPPTLTLFRNFEAAHDGEMKPSEQKIRFAARCSSAAPTYFPSVENKYVDGGLMANNPTADLLTEVHLQSLAEDPEDPTPIRCILSVGTGVAPPKPIEKLDLEVPKNFGLSTLGSILGNISTITNLKNVYIEQLAASDGAIVDRCRAWAASTRTPFFRFTPHLDRDYTLNETDNTAIVDMMWCTKLYVESLSRDQIADLIDLITDKHSE